MTHELILTSVAQGLDPKDRGFCPVAADSDISPRVIELLTAMSGYRYLIEESGNLSPQSPVAYSHIILPSGIEHVLSRVAGAGTDYQDKPNALAHHVCLEQPENTPESPAWVLALPGFHFSEWNAPPIRFTQGRPIPTLTTPQSLTRRQQIARQLHWLDPQKMALTGFVDTESESYLTAVHRNDEQCILAAAPTTPCPVWEEWTGDAGWGGVLAETAFTGQQVVLIYNSEQNILPLFVEALALLPEYTAWRTTFCTYFTGLPEGIACQWKAVIANSDEVKPLVKDLNNLVIDLTIPMGEALGGQYVDFARFGQERMLPLDMEERFVSIVAANADTKTYYDETNRMSDRLNNTPPNPAPSSAPIPVQVIEPNLPPPKVQLPPKRAGILESLLRRSSRSQFYLLYSIMFILVLFLLFLAVDQAGNLGIIKSLRHGNQPSVVPPDAPVQHPPSETNCGLDDEPDVGIAQVEEKIPVNMEDARKIFAEHRAQQREPLLQFWATFAAPEFLASNFPNVRDGLVDLPEKKTFAGLSPLFPFGAALQLRFIPLFELPNMKVETLLVVESLPDLVWQIYAVDTAIDTDLDLTTPMFRFQLTKTGLEMDWQLEGMNSQYLYNTVLSSLAFLELSVADVPESAKEIPLFTPVETTPMKVSDLANLSEQEPPEYAVALPFASELWQAIFDTTRPAHTLRLDVRAEPAEDWVRVVSPSESEFQAEVRTTQQSRKPAEGVDTFENIAVTFTAKAALAGVVWKGDEYVERLRAEREGIRLSRADLDEKIDQLGTEAFGGNENARRERVQFTAESRTLKHRLDEIDSILERLPASFEEISQNESGQFRYSVILESESTNRQLLILRTVPFTVQ